MKIGCCLAYFKNHNNYGTTLQGYATVKVLQSLNQDVRIIKYQKHDSLIKKIRIAPLQIISGGYKAYIKRYKKYKMEKQNNDYAYNMTIRTKANNKFKDKWMEPLCDNYTGYASLSKGSKSYDAVLVGSDQVWTPLSLYSNFYNLNFVADEVRKISYASSFGVSFIPSWQRKATGAFLNRINYLSVRELRAKEIVEEVSSNHATVVCDPTLLRKRQEWECDLEGVEIKASQPYILCYLLGGVIRIGS